MTNIFAEMYLLTDLFHTFWFLPPDKRDVYLHVPVVMTLVFWTNKLVEVSPTTSEIKQLKLHVVKMSPNVSLSVRKVGLWGLLGLLEKEN